jgi:hypothetical protein
VLQVTRAGAVKVAADARRHLKALLVTAPESLRASLRSGTWLRQAHTCAALTAAPNRSGGVPGHSAGVADHGCAGPGRPSGGQAARQGASATFLKFDR